VPEGRYRLVIAGVAACTELDNCWSIHDTKTGRVHLNQFCSRASSDSVRVILDDLLAGRMHWHDLSWMKTDANLDPWQRVVIRRGMTDAD